MKQKKKEKKSCKKKKNVESLFSNPISDIVVKPIHS